MNVHYFLFCIVVIAAIAPAAAGVSVRYNYCGYNPTRQKQLIVMADSHLGGNAWTISNGKGRTVLSAKFGSPEVKKGDHTPMQFNYSVDFSSIRDQGTYTFQTEGSKRIALVIAKNPYAAVAEEPLAWLRNSRCGFKEAGQANACHAGDEACDVCRRDDGVNTAWAIDKAHKKLRCIGGWHDGSYLKFTLTIGYTTYFLLRAYELNPELYKRNRSTTDLVDILDEARWGLEYLRACMPDTGEFIIQVGDERELEQGLRLPQDDKLNGLRPCFSALSGTQMGFCAAALAAGSRIFNHVGKRDDAKRYQAMASAIYRRGRSKEAAIPAWVSSPASDFYNDDSPTDNMYLAAVELYTLTKDSTYLRDAKAYSDKFRYSLKTGWRSVALPAQLALFSLYPVVNTDLKKELDAFLHFAKRSDNLWHLPLKYSWGGFSSAVCVAASALQYQILTKDTTYALLGRSVVDYLLGCNNWGLCFMATQKVKYSIKHPYSAVYTLQSDLFPTGGLCAGPVDRRTHERYRPFLAYDFSAQKTDAYNTAQAVFYDHPKDFLCMETTLCSTAEGLYLLSLASRVMKD
ncbi:MAG: glycoside hydrolase family 9 protein [Chitinivibrionales bacterium]|nr:glycoside hydrolase family 9 protein [Chitinivibrionales bacterium]